MSGSCKGCRTRQFTMEPASKHLAGEAAAGGSLDGWTLPPVLTGLIPFAELYAGRKPRSGKQEGLSPAARVGLSWRKTRQAVRVKAELRLENKAVRPDGLGARRSTKLLGEGVSGGQGSLAQSCLCKTVCFLKFTSECSSKLFKRDTAHLCPTHEHQPPRGGAQRVLLRGV